MMVPEPPRTSQNLVVGPLWWRSGGLEVIEALHSGEQVLVSAELFLSDGSAAGPDSSEVLVLFTEGQCLAGSPQMWC